LGIEHHKLWAGTANWTTLRLGWDEEYSQRGRIKLDHFMLAEPERGPNRAQVARRRRVRHARSENELGEFVNDPASEEEPLAAPVPAPHVEKRFAAAHKLNRSPACRSCARPGGLDNLE